MNRKPIRKTRTFFSEQEREERVSSLPDPLVRLNNLIPWEEFRTILSCVRKPSLKGGRPPYDEIFMFKRLVLQELYGLSDEKLEFEICNRRDFERFLGMDITSDIPDHSTINNFRNQLKAHNLVIKLHEVFNRFLQEEGLILRKGVIVDATFVESPRRHCTREENRQINSGSSIPEVFPDKSVQSNSHRDGDARWTVKNGRAHFGYKDHIVCDSKSKFIIQYEVTPANVHDSQELINLIPPTVTNEEPFYADAAYDSRAIHKELLERGFIPRIIKSARRFRSLTAEDREENRKKSSTRCRIEHVFGDIKNRRNGLRIMTIGLARAKTKPGLINLVYNMRRYQTITTRCLQF